MKRSGVLSPSAASVCARLALVAVTSVALAAWAIPSRAFPLPSQRPGPTEAPLARLFPEQSFAYVELLDAAELVRAFPDSRLRRAFDTDPRLAAYRQSEEYEKLLAGVAFVEALSGLKVSDLAAGLLGRRMAAGLVAGAEGTEPGLLVAVEVGDEEGATTLARVLRGVAALQGADTVSSGEHRGTEWMMVDGKIALGVLGSKLVASSRTDLLCDAVDRFLDAANSFARTEAHRDLETRLAQGGRAALHVDLATLRGFSDGGRIGPERQPEAIASLLFQDLLEVLNVAPSVRGTLVVDGERLGLDLEMPGVGALPERLAFFVPERAQQEMLRTPLLPEGFLSLTGWRDMARFWEDRALLLDEGSEKGFAEFESGLGIFFSGKSVPDDLLPQLHPDWLLIGARQTFDEGPVPPDLRFPCGALVLHAREPESMFAEMSVAFHSLLAILNVQRGEQGQTPMQLFVEPGDPAPIYGGRFLQNDGRPVDAARFNFSPAMTRVGDRILLSTSEELLDDLVAAWKEPDGGMVPANEGTLTQLRIDLPPALRALQENREALVAQSVVDEGKSFEEAGNEFDLVMLALSQARSLQLGSRLVDGAMHLRLDLRWEGGAPLSSAPVAKD